MFDFCLIFAWVMLQSSFQGFQGKNRARNRLHLIVGNFGLFLFEGNFLFYEF